MTLTFTKFAEMAAAEGLTARKYTFDHWQLWGGMVLVNVYPFSNKGFRIYVAGTASATESNPKNAFHVAKTGELSHAIGPKRNRRRSSPKYYRRIKKLLFDKRPHCGYCDAKLTLEEATIDHIIPLDRGGSNGQDNLRLACKACNGKKGNQMPKPHQLPRPARTQKYQAEVPQESP
jgi:5-methylcytosine-specific restriction endonuclease McrA